MDLRRFIYKTGLFSLIIISLLIAGEIIVRSIDNPYKLKKDYMDKNAEKIKTLILGHSQTYYGIDPGLMSDSAFNLAMVSQTLPVDRMLLEKYSDRLSSLRMVIVPVTYTSLYENELEDGDEWWRVINYELYMGLKKHSFLSRYEAEICNISGYAGKLAVVFGLRHSQFVPDSLGLGTEYALKNKYNEWRDTGVKTALAHTESLNLNRLSVNIAELEKIYSICQKKDVTLVLVTPPVWHVYMDNINNDLWCRTVNEINRFTSERKNVLWLDYSKDSRFNDDDFYDADHLTSDVGAVKFTTILQDALD